MLLLPVAQEDSTVRRTPWISFGIIALNLLVFLYTGVLFPLGPSARRVEERARELFAYYSEHPYLLVPPDLTRRLGPEFQDELEQARAAHAASHALPPEFVVAREQARLDELGEALTAELRRNPIERFGFVPIRREPLTLLTSMFVHADWLHLLGNMWFLFLVAPFVEDRFGRAVFPALYALSGVVATTVHTLHDPGSAAPLVGASGAIAGVMGAFLVRLGASWIRFLCLPIPVLPFIRFSVSLPAFVVLPLWLGEQFLYAREAGDGSGVAWWAHIGGFVFGAVVAGALRITRVEETWIDAGIEREVSLVRHPSLERAIDARSRGSYALARTEIAKVLSAHPDDLDAWTEACEIAIDEGNGNELARVVGRTLELLFKAGEQGLALRLLEEVRHRGPDPLPAQYHVAVAGAFEKAGDRLAAVKHYEEAIERAPESPAALRAWFRKAEIARQGGDAVGARRAYEKARAHPACAGTWPEILDKALAALPQRS